MAGSFVEVTLNSSNTNSSLLQLQGFEQPREKVQDEEKLFANAAGAFSYEKQSKLTKNRYILWRVIDNIIQLEEFSLDYNLYSNKLSISITNEVLLPNLCIIEDDNELSICFSTSTSIHRIVLPHPNHEKYGYIVPSGMNISLPSIFHQADTKFKHEKAELTIPCVNFDVTITENNMFFALNTEQQTLLVASMLTEEDNCIELKDTGLMQRLWTGLVPSFVRGDSSMVGVSSVLIHNFDDEEIFAFTICKDFKIRVWNILTKSCVLVKDLVSLIPDNLDNQEEIGSLLLRKVKGDSAKQLTIAAHCCLSYSSQFIIMEVFKEPNDIVMMHVSNFFSDFNSIEDFCVTPQYLWALWGTNDGDFVVSYAPIEGGKDFERGWHSAHLKKNEDKDLYISVYQDAKEVYLEKIFSPQTYDKGTLLKALQIFTSNTGTEMLPDTNSNTNTVKECLIRILDSEIEMLLLSSDVEVSKYQELQSQCWSKFYSIFQQCLQLREKPIGIFADKTNSSILLVRQEVCGYFYYHDWIDHLWISDLNSCEASSSYIDNELELDDEVLSEDVLSIIECCKLISKQFPSEVIQGIDSDLDRNEDVKRFLTSMATVLVTNSSEFDQLVGDALERGDFICQIEGPLKNIQYPQKAFEMILSALKCLDFNSSINLDQSENGSGNVQFLCSSDGITVLSNLICTTSYHRMHLCRDLFILMTLMDEMSCKLKLNGPEMKELNILMSDVCYELLRSFHCIYWSAIQRFEKVEENLLETNLTNLAALNITEKSPASNTARKVGSDDPNHTLSYLFCFLRDFGLQNALSYLTESNLNDLKPGDYSSGEMLKLILKVSMNDLWVLNEKTSDFPEYLASHGQYFILNSFIHLCDGWCSANRGTKDFFLGQSYLGTNQPDKAFKYFAGGARGISQMEPLLLKLVEYNENSEENFDSQRQDLLLSYFIKVMRIFEQFDYPTYVVTMATTALTITDSNNPNLPMLWTVIFKYNLELEHYKDAYSAIIHNADKSRRFDCLRHFVVTLCEGEMFQELCSYPYVGLEEEVVSILESRARTIDITVNKYYDLLYSYHILKNDYRKASTAMYEQACRLSTEMHGLRSLQKQAKCYLACMSALSLVEKKYAWIVKPRDKTLQVKHSDEKASAAGVCHSPKRKEDGQEVYHSKISKSNKSKTVIMEMKDLEKEYLLSLARLKLIQYGRTDSIALGPGITPHEIVGLLCQLGLFDMAFTVAEKFKIPLQNVFESLAGKCAAMSYRNLSDFDEEWKWLSYNEINTSQLVTAKSASQHSFHLLQNYLKKYNTTNSSVLYKSVTSKLLSTGCVLPAWLVLDYQKCNPSELLHLYLSYDLIEDAFKLAIKYIEAVLGVGKEQLGIQNALHATTPAVWLPYTYFDQLMLALKTNSATSDDAFAMFDEFQSKLDVYFKQQEVVSCDKLDYLYKVNNRIH